MTLVCKDINNLYLDEPEQGLSYYEIDMLCSLLNRSKSLYDNIIITTHSWAFIQTFNDCFTVSIDDKGNTTLNKVPDDDIFKVAGETP